MLYKNYVSIAKKTLFVKRKGLNNGIFLASPCLVRYAGVVKPIILYELDAIIPDDLSRAAEPLAEYLDRSEESVREAITKTAGPYLTGETNQYAYWESLAEHLGLAEAEILGGFAINAAEADAAVLGRIRGQSERCLLGLVSDATPDWVSHFRQKYQLDRLLHVHIINSDFAIEKPYPKLLRTAAERLNADPAQIRFVASKERQLHIAQELGFRTVDARSDLAAAFTDLA
jgi:FMN phosphatase YigB (HAD superfamily)